MKVNPSTAIRPAEARVRVVRPGQTLPLTGPADLMLEDGTVLRVDAALPSDLPFGYHELRPLDGGAAIRLIVSPGRCYRPDALRTWGWAVHLYALRSVASWGIGDLVDLRRLARWSATQLNAGILLVNPLYAASPIVPQQPSPYCPSSRLYRNPLYLRIEEVPGAAEVGVDLEDFAVAGRALNQERRIDRDAIFRSKMAALEHLWARFRGALAEHHGHGWRRWPVEHRRPDTPAVACFAAERIERVRFHQWLQWLLDVQLAQAAAELPLMLDLPIGVDPDGADAWAWQDVLGLDVTIGAPPEEYNTLGQDWGLPPFVPHQLRATGYEPFRQTLRASLRRARGLRIDHVMGLFRLFWIPQGVDTSQGAYVRYPADELLAIVALESQRAGALVVGEDLGTVAKGVPEQLAAHHVLSYHLLWFETETPSHYPELVLAAVTTHDLPTIAGLWGGADLRTQHALGLHPNEAGLQEIRARLQTMTGLPETAEIREVIVRAHRLPAEAPSLVVAATLEDALAVEDRPNVPNTTTEWPNCALALPASLELLERHPLPREIGAVLGRRRHHRLGTPGQ